MIEYVDNSLDDFYEALMKRGNGVPIKGFYLDTDGRRVDKTVLYVRADAATHHVVYDIKDVRGKYTLPPNSIRPQLIRALGLAS